MLCFLVTSVGTSYGSYSSTVVLNFRITLYFRLINAIALSVHLRITDMIRPSTDMSVLLKMTYCILDKRRENIENTNMPQNEFNSPFKTIRECIFETCRTAIVASI